jgi:hypothetical protein
MRSRSVFLALVGTLGSGLVAVPAVAAPNEARELVARATQAFLHRDYEEARQALQRAYALEPEPATLAKLAMAELQTDHPVDAVQHFREYLTHTDEPAETLAAVRTKYLPRAEAKTARVEVHAPEHADVLIDGTPEGRGPMASIIVADGEHEVTAKQGAVVETQHISAHGGELVELHFQRVPDAPAEVPGAIPAAKGLPADRTTPDSSWPTGKWIAVGVLASSAGAALGVGILEAMRSNADASSARSFQAQLDNSACWRAPQSPTCQGLERAIRSTNDEHALSVGAYAAGGALAAIAIATSLLWRPSGHIVPSVSAHSASAVWSVRW